MEQSTGFSPAKTLIRPFDVRDADALHRIHTACLTRTLVDHYPPAVINAWREGRTPAGYSAAAQKGERFWVADCSGIVLAFASWQDDELLSLFVDPDRHREGLGSQILAACDADAASLDKALVKVKAALGADGFYRRHGFMALGPGQTRKKGVPIPDLRMVRGGASNWLDDVGD